MSEKVVVIGLDAACFDRIDPFLERGDLPNLQRLLDRGGGTDLETTTPPWTPSAWPSIVTGTEPQAHGVYDFFNHGPDYEHELVSAKDIQVPFLWEYLSERGQSSIVVNVPVTNPAHAFDGTLIPGYLAPENPTCLVDGEARPLSEIDPEYRIYADRNDPDEATLDEYERLIHSRASLSKRLADEYDWSFMMVQFQRTDSVYHTFGADEEAASRVYSAVDKAIGSLLDGIDEECNVLVVSDHGIWQYESVFYVNSWLKENGYLATTADSNRIGWNATTKEKLKGDHGETGSTSARIGGAVIGALDRVGLSPQVAEALLAKVGLDTAVRKLLPNEILEDSIRHVDWSNSDVYCRSTSSLGLRFNVEERETDGVVSSDSFETARKRLIEELEAIESPDGEPVFDEVLDRHDVWGDDIPNESSAPDIIYRPNDMRWEISDIVKSDPFESTEVFNHNYSGLLIAAGPDIEWKRPGQPHATDIAPTILSLLGVSPPAEMSGAVLESICTSDQSTERPPTVGGRRYLGDGDTTETDSVVADRLRDMGYME
ncbi:alkaline phosphatase family protein [Natronomonas amylolytica]|uniref:alkaline phosphatase family protein n=1 Tax=Natronomonas amylolytica TaxID=3108498 RepID=UPI00300A220A